MVFSPDPDVVAATRNLMTQRRFLRENSGTRVDQVHASDDSRVGASTAGSNPGTGASNRERGDVNRTLAGPSSSISATPGGNTSIDPLSNPSADHPSENAVVIAVPDRSVGDRRRRRAVPPSSDCVGGCDGGLRPHAPLLVDVFAAVIISLFTIGVVACAVAFPIQGARDADASERRWEVTLARWSAARQFSGVQRLAGFYDSSVGAGVDAFFLEDAAADFDFAGNEDTTVDEGTTVDSPAEGPAGSLAAAAAAVDALARLGS